MKQVQRSDDNPAVFDVTYRGTHTCHHRKPTSHSFAAAASSTYLDHCSNNDQHLLLSFQTNLQVKTENLDSNSQQEPAHTPFSFPSTPIDTPSSTPDNSFKSAFNAAFFSPATSESNYFSASPCRVSSYRGGPSVQASESDFAEIVLAASSAANSPMLDLDFPLPELDTDFMFDASTFFS